MAVETLIPVEEYLRTSYSPDVEYVDGELVELNVGDPLHSLVQSNIIFALRTKYKNVKVLPEVRSKVTSTRYRLPDICVTLTFPGGKVLLDPPFVAVEILSEDDRMSRVIERLLEFAAIGTPQYLGDRSAPEKDVHLSWQHAAGSGWRERSPPPIRAWN